MDAEPVTVRIQRLPHGEAIDPPQYMTDGAAAADIRAALDADIVIESGAVAMVPTGFAMEIPPGWVLSIRPRSGLAVKHGVTVVNAPATIDSDYRGEVKVALVNLGREPLTITRGMRIAQVMLERVTRIAWEEAETLAPTARGAGGFGHSGV
jgi:dUTP pyrophosphatase